MTVTARVTPILNFRHQLKDGAMPPEVDGVPQVLHFVGSPPIEMSILEQTLSSAATPSIITL